MADVNWWLSRLVDPEWRGSRIWFDRNDMPCLTIKSDASGEIGAGYHVGSEKVVAYSWEDVNVPLEKSIAFKELYPALMAARAHCSEWSHKLVRCGLDNAGCVYMINSGSSVAPDCADLLRELADLQAEHSFEILASWVPREFNEAADSLSRLLVEQAQTQAKLEEGAISFLGSNSPGMTTPSHASIYSWKPRCVRPSKR